MTGPPPSVYHPETLGLEGNALLLDRWVQAARYEAAHRGPRCACTHTAAGHLRGGGCSWCDCPAFRRPLIPVLAALARELIRRHHVPTIVRRALRRLQTLIRLLDHLEEHMSAPTPSDRSLITTILAGLGPIVDGIRAKDATIAELRQRLVDAGVAAAEDEAADTLALAPVAEAVEAAKAALAASSVTPAAEPAPIPVEQLPSAVEAAATTEQGDPGAVPDSSTTA